MEEKLRSPSASFVSILGRAPILKMGLYEEILSRIISIVFIAFIIYLLYLIMKRNAKKHAENTKEVLICPKCGSLRLERINNPGDIVMGEVSSKNTFECRDCNYTGLTPTIDRTDIESFRKELKNIKK